MFNTMNIPYKLDIPHKQPASRFSSIWKVEVDESYRIIQHHGLSEPAIFLTHGGQGVVRIAGQNGQSTTY